MLLNILKHILEKLHNIGFTILEHCGFDFNNLRRLPQKAWYVRNTYHWSYKTGNVSHSRD